MAPVERMIVMLTLILQVITSNQQAVVLPTATVPTAIAGAFTSDGLTDQFVARAATSINWRSKFYRFLQGRLNGDDLSENDLTAVQDMAKVLAALKQSKLNDISAPALRPLLTSEDVTRDVPSVVRVLENIDLVKFFDILTIATPTSVVGQNGQTGRSVTTPVSGLPISTPLRDAILRIGISHLQGDLDDSWKNGLNKLSPYLPGLTVGHVNSVKESEQVADKLLELLQNVRSRLSAPVRANVVRYFKRVKAGNWSTEENVIQSLGVFVGDVTGDDVQNITLDTWKLVFNSFRLEDIEPVLARGILDKLLYANVTVTDPPDNIRKLGQLACVLPEALGYKANALSQDVWRELARVLHTCTVSGPGGTVLSRPGRKLAQRIAKAVIMLNSPSSATATDLRNAGVAIVGLQVSDLRQLQARSVYDAISDISQAQGLSRGQAQVLLEKYVSGKGSPVTSSDLSRLGNIAAAVDSDTLAQFGQQSLQGALSTLIPTADRMLPSQRKAVVKKVVGSSPDSVVDDLGTLTPDLSLGSVTNVFPSQQDIPGLATLPWNQGQAANLIKRIRETRELTPSLIGTLGTLLLGLRCPDVDAVALHDVVEVVVLLYGHVSQLPRGVRVCLANATQVAMNITLKTSGAVTGASDAMTAVPGEVAIEMPFEVLASSPRPDCSDVFRNIGKIDLSQYPPWYQGNLTELALTCLNKRNNQQLNAADVDVLGKLLCHVDDFFRIADAAVLDSIAVLKACQCFTLRQREAVKDLIRKAFGNDPRWWSSYDLGQAGPLLHLMDDSDLQRISQDALLDALDFVLPVPQDSGNLINRNISADKDCLAVRRSDDLYTRVIQAVARGRTSPRQKRQSLSAPLLCDQVQLLGDAVVQLTEQQVTYMEDTEFLDCLDVFGAARQNNTDWDNYMLRVLRLKTFRAAGGTVRQLTPDTMARVGRIAVTFQPAELSALNYGSVDNVYGIAKHSGYTKQQLEAAFTAFLSQNGNDVSVLTERELIGLGNFLCGMTTSQVSRINLGAFSESVRRIGLLTDCDNARLVALRSLAGKLYGGPNSWGQDTILELGVVAAGLSSSELSGLHEDRLRAITPLAISVMDPNKFKSAFSVWRIGRLGPSQAMAVTDKQLKVLSQAQRDAVNHAALGQNGNTASSVQVNLTILVVSIYCAHAAKWWS